jgi:hypothetical protein
LGSLIADNNSLEKHIEAILNYPLVNKKAIEAAIFLLY